MQKSTITMSSDISDLKSALEVFPSHHTCPQCPKTFFFGSSLTLHLETDHPTVPCPHCPRTYLLQKSLDDHVAAEHQPAEQAETKPIVPSEFEDEDIPVEEYSSLVARTRPANQAARIKATRTNRLTISNLQSVVGDDEFDCPFCEDKRAFESWGMLDVHIKEEHWNAGYVW